MWAASLDLSTTVSVARFAASAAASIVAFALSLRSLDLPLGLFMTSPFLRFHALHRCNQHAVGQTCTVRQRHDEASGSLRAWNELAAGSTHGIFAASVTLSCRGFGKFFRR